MKKSVKVIKKMTGSSYFSVIVFAGMSAAILLQSVLLFLSADLTFFCADDFYGFIPFFMIFILALTLFSMSAAFLFRVLKIRASLNTALIFLFPLTLPPSVFSAAFEPVFSPKAGYVAYWGFEHSSAWAGEFSVGFAALIYIPLIIYFWKMFLPCTAFSVYLLSRRAHSGKVNPAIFVFETAAACFGLSLLFSHQIYSYACYYYSRYSSVFVMPGIYDRTSWVLFLLASSVLLLMAAVISVIMLLSKKK